MNLPGFTAEASICVAGDAYETLRFTIHSAGANKVVPAAPPENIECLCNPSRCLCCWWRSGDLPRCLVFE